MPPCHPSAAERIGSTHPRGLFAVALLACAGLSHAAADADLDAQWVVKLAAYVDCVNTHGNWTLQSRDRYYSWMESPRKGPSGREPVVYGLYELRDPAPCREGVAAAAGLPLTDAELEAAAADFVAALDEAVAATGEANAYYALEDWKDDRMRKGKAMHPRLVAAFDAFASADMRLRERVQVLQEGIAARRLARLAEDPAQRADFLVERLLLGARALMQQVDTMGGKDFDRAAWQASVDAYEADWRAFDAFRREHPRHPSKAMGSSAFANASFDLLKAAKSTARRERDGFRFDTGERMLIDASAAQMVDGHPAQLVAKFNTFITWLNSVRR